MGLFCGQKYIGVRHVKKGQGPTNWFDHQRLNVLIELRSCNKAGYTANTSRGRVGRGGYARFHTFQLDHHGPTNRPTDQRTDGQSLL